MENKFDLRKVKVLTGVLLSIGVLLMIIYAFTR